MYFFKTYLFFPAGQQWTSCLHGSFPWLGNLAWSPHGTTQIFVKSEKYLLLPKQKVSTLVIPLLKLQHDFRKQSTWTCRWLLFLLFLHQSLLLYLQLLESSLTLMMQCYNNAKTKPTMTVGFFSFLSSALCNQAQQMIKTLILFQINLNFKSKKYTESSNSM